MTKFGFLLAFLGVLFMSFESPAISFVKVSGFDYSFLFGIFIFLSLNFVSFIKHGQKNFIKNYKEQKIALFMCGFFMLISNLSFIYSVKFLGIALPVLIYATSPVICAILDFLLYKKNSQNSLFIVSFFVLVGIFIISYDKLEFKSIFGIFLGFLSVISFAFLFTTLSFYKNLDRASSMGFGGILIAFVSLPFVNFAYDLQDFLVIFLVGIFITPISRIFLSYSLLYINAANVGLICILESVFAIFWGFLFLNQTITANIAIGGTIILISISFYILKLAK